jgi:hypothetical protein
VRYALLFAGLAVLLGVGAAAAGPRCATDPRVVAVCTRLHGKLFAANGTPTFRIARLGTTRILGISDEANGLPPAIATLMLIHGDALTMRIFADFRVCPFTRQRPGAMQFVCVDRASHVVAQELRGAAWLRLERNRVKPTSLHP